MTLETTVANSIRRMIAGSGNSQRSLSRKLGKSPGYISSTLSQDLNVSASSFFEMADVMGYTFTAHGHDDEFVIVGSSAAQEGGACDDEYDGSQGVDDRPGEHA